MQRIIYLLLMLGVVAFIGGCSHHSSEGKSGQKYHGHAASWFDTGVDTSPYVQSARYKREEHWEHK